MPRLVAQLESGIHMSHNRTIAYNTNDTDLAKLVWSALYYITVAETLAPADMTQEQLDEVGVLSKAHAKLLLTAMNNTFVLEPTEEFPVDGTHNLMDAYGKFTGLLEQATFNNNL